MKFKDFLLKEEKEKHAVLAFGRMSPPTTGHEVLVNKVKDVAKQHNASHHVVLSHTQDAKKNPLSTSDKLKHARRFFPDTNITASNKEAPNFLEQAKKLHQKGVTHLHMVAGSDRVPEYKQLLQKYNGKHEGALFNFKEIHVHSAGERDPDAEGVEGMSASKMREHAKSGNLKEFQKGIPKHIKPHHAKEMFDDVRKGMGVKDEKKKLPEAVSLDEQFETLLTEGVHDKGIFKAVFLAGGPGSGKDYVLDNTLAGHGLVEINSDKALEFLMDKEGLDKTMPSGETEKRDIVRGRAKNVTELKQRLALQGRNGVIINGTGDDVEKIAKIKERLEQIGYETSMVAVNTADEVSKQRNIERGTRGGRTVPEEIRKKKWDAVQAARPQFAEMFGQNYTEFDNSEDLRQAPPEVVKAKQDEMLEIFKGVKQFIETPPQNEKAQEWIANELNNKDTLTVTSDVSEKQPHPNSAAAEEAGRLGLQYYGFGRYGKDGKVTYHSVHDKLVPITKIKAPEPNIPVSSSSGVKKVNEEFENLFEAVTISITADTPEEAAKAVQLLKSEPVVEPQKEEQQYQLSDNGARNLLSLGKETEIYDLDEAIKRQRQTALDRFRAAASEREKEHNKREAEMKARHASGKEDMSGAIDKLAQRLNKEEVLDEISKHTLQDYASKATHDAIARATSGKGGSLDRFLNVQKAKDKIHQADMKTRSNVKQTPMSESHENLLKDKTGKVRIFMLRRAAAKEAHINGGVVHKQGNGYVIKLKENEDVTSTNQPIQEETRSGNSTTSIGTGLITESTGSCGATKEQSCDCGCESGEEKSTTRKTITVKEAKKIYKEKINEIDMGTEPGVSMSGSGENPSRGSSETTRAKKKPFDEMTGDETTASIGDQKEDELKKQSINLSSFRKRNYTA